MNFRKRTYSKISLSFLFLFLVASVFAEETDSKGVVPDYQELFSGYKASDIELQKLEIQLQQAQLEYQKVLIANGVAVNVSTGNISVGLNGDETTVSVAPSVSVGIPQWSNTSIEVSSPFSFNITDSGSSTTLGSANGSSGAAVKLSTDIISSSTKQRSVTLQKAERTLLEAERKLASREVTVGKAFLTELKSLFNEKLSVLKAQEDLIKKQVDFETVVTMGYSPTSSKYRSANLVVRSYEQSLEESQRTYKASLQLIGEKCGYSNLSDIELDIPSVEMLSILDFDPSFFAALESSEWNHYINTLSRDATKSGFTLSANAGYSIAGGIGSGSSFDSLTSSVSGGLTGSYNGISVSAGVAVPINTTTSKGPSITLSATWSPNTSKSASLTNKISEYTNEIEQLSILEARQNYAENVTTYETKRANLKWQLEKNIEELSMYQELMEDTEIWYKQGLVSGSDYRETVTNYENAKAAVVITKIEQLIYNADVIDLFITE